jgi:hypothetical protein
MRWLVQARDRPRVRPICFTHAILRLTVAPASGILKKAIALQKELGPSSKLHAKKDITQLRACVQKIKTLVLATPFEKASYVIEDVQTALAAIR